MIAGVSAREPVHKQPLGGNKQPLERLAPVINVKVLFDLAVNPRDKVPECGVDHRRGRPLRSVPKDRNKRAKGSLLNYFT